ncbi:hypothetical protein B296_00057938, partial [Ensete ventricosum]
RGPLLEPEVSEALEQRLRFAEFSKKPHCSHRSTIFVGASSEERCVRHRRHWPQPDLSFNRDPRCSFLVEIDPSPATQPRQHIF